MGTFTVTMRFRLVSLPVFTLVFMAASIAMNASAQIVKEGLVSYWTFDGFDMEDETVKDVFGGNDGTIIGAQIVDDGWLQEALYFDGVDDYVEVPDSPSLNITDAITIEAWVKTRSLNGRWKTMISKLKDNSYQLRTNRTGSIQYLIETNKGEVLISQPLLSVDTWYHLVGTYDGSKMCFYVDGSLIECRPQTGNITTSTEPLRIGRTSAGEFWPGTIDEVKIYDRALTQNEVQQNYNAISGFAVEAANKLAITWGGIKAKD